MTDAAPVDPPVTVDPKPRSDSKTYWCNGLIIVSAVVVALVYIWKTGGTITPEAIGAILTAVVSALNLALRETTTQPLQGMFSKKAAALLAVGTLLAGSVAGAEQVQAPSSEKPAASTPDKVAVPNVIGLKWPEASNKLTAAGLRIYLESGGPTEVITDQDEPAGSQVFSGWVVSVKTKPAAKAAADLLPLTLQDGTYILPDNAQIKTIRVLVIGGQPPGPVPPGPSPPAPLTDFGKAIKAAADKATGDTDRANTAQGLAMLYRAISAEAHKAGTSATVETVSNTSLQVTDLALAKQGSAAVKAWADERAALRAALVDAIQTGKTVPQMGDLLDEAASGLEASAPKAASQAPSPAFWDFLLKLIEMLLPLLIPK